MTTGQDIIAAAAVFGIKATLWEKAGKCRIYAKTDRRDISVYLELDGSVADIEGAALKVFCNADQHPNWISAQVKEYREIYKPLFHAYVVAQYGAADGDSAHVAYFGNEPVMGGPSMQEMIFESRAAFAKAKEMP